MFIDALCLLSDAQAVSADAASTNTYDLGASTNNISIGEPLVAVFQIDVAADGTTTDETYEFQVIESASANLGTPTILVQRSIGYASLTAGSVHYLPIPQGSIAKRYLGVYYNVGGTTPSVTVTAFIQPASMLQKDNNYPDGITIS